MKHEDDFISKLMDETYNQVEHPSNELSNQNVASLFDYFKEREDAVESSPGGAVTVNQYNAFLRISVQGQTLDVPKNLDWVSPLKTDEDNAVYEIKDETFSHIVSELCGRTVKFIVIEESSVELCAELPSSFGNTPRAA